jgi:hypothetical protein
LQDAAGGRIVMENVHAGARDGSLLLPFLGFSPGTFRRPFLFFILIGANVFDDRHRNSAIASPTSSKWRRGENHSLDSAEDYFTKTIVGLHEKTQSSISAETKMAPVWDEPIYTMCFSKPANISPDFILDGGF